MKQLIILIYLLIAGPNLVSGATLSGYVYNDTNGNGSRDKNESGISNVAVSDQVNVVYTDSKGFYEFRELKGFNYVFISVPTGFATTSYYSLIAAGSPSKDFPLTALVKTNPRQYTFIHASDTHISPQSLDRIQKFRAIIDSVKPEFVIVTGDLIKDALRVPEKEAVSLYELYKSEVMQKIKVPVWNAPGNHEIFGIERHLSLVSTQHPLYGRKMFRYYLGPDYYSFNYGGIHFVALNSLEFEDLWYYGSIDSVQREWLKQDLSHLDPSTPVVTFQHVPFISGELSITGYTVNGPGRSLELEKGQLQFRHVVSNAHDVISVLRTHPFPLALGGHHHTRQRFFLQTEGQQTRFEQTAAIVAPVEAGAFKMPSGVVVYHVRDGRIDEGTFVSIR